MSRMRQAGRGTVSGGILSRSGRFARATPAYGTSSDRLVEAMSGRKARHDQVAMCLLRKDVEHVLPARRASRIARRRRQLVISGLLACLWWLGGRFLL